MRFGELWANQILSKSGYTTRRRVVVGYGKTQKNRIDN